MNIDIYAYVELYKNSNIEEKRILKKMIYSLKNISEAKKDGLWLEIVRLGGVVNEFEGMQERNSKTTK